ncbi:hypothetical protein KM043_015603 [Ampulex compressa]|nr:hypothetical protein KM043_015603 [Ampulex compressa]
MAACSCPVHDAYVTGATEKIDDDSVPYPYQTSCRRLYSDNDRKGASARLIQKKKSQSCEEEEGDSQKTGASLVSRRPRINTVPVITHTENFINLRLFRKRDSHRRYERNPQSVQIEPDYSIERIASTSTQLRRCPPFEEETSPPFRVVRHE